MMQLRFQLDHPGIAELLKSEEMQRFVKDTAERVAARVAGQHLTASTPGDNSPAEIQAEVTVTVSDRARAEVAINHPAGVAMQAKHGVLTKAAAEEGLEVKARRRG